MAQALRGGLVLLDLSTRSRVVRAVSFQYNPDVLYRTLAPGPDGPLETIELELDALSAGATQAPLGIQPQLAALESVAVPARSLAASPLTVLVWGQSRTVPVRVTELLVTEDAFDQVLHPIRATVAATMEVLDAPRRTHASADAALKAEHQLVRKARADLERQAKRGAAKVDADL